MNRPLIRCLSKVIIKLKQTSKVEVPIMKKSFKLLSVILIIGIAFSSCNKGNESQLNLKNCEKVNFTKLEGPYLGQKPPGDEPELFAPGLLSAGSSSELNISFSHDGLELCYSLYVQISGGDVYIPGKIG